MTSALGAPEQAVERAGMLARGLSVGRRAGARLSLGGSRALWTDLREVHLPWPPPPHLAAGPGRLVACVALQASPTKEAVAELEARWFSPRELAALQLSEAQAALGWAHDEWPGLGAALQEATGGLAPATWSNVSGAELAERAALLAAERRGSLDVPPSLGALPLRGLARSKLSRVLDRLGGGRVGDAAERLGHVFGFGGIPIAGAEDDGLGDGAPPLPGDDRVVEADPAAGLPYPEWDLSTETYRADHVIVRERRLAARGPVRARPRPELEAWFTAPLDRRRRGRLEDGADVDVDGVVDALIDLATGVESVPRVYHERLRVDRDVSCAILIDASGSLARESLLEHGVACADALVDAMDQAGERHAVFAFASDSRHDVTVDVLQGFDERAVAPSAAKLRAGRYTRMGAAIRHACSHLERERSGRRALLVLSDGVPFDEGYEDDYACADVEKAVEEAETLGIEVFVLGVGHAHEVPVLGERLGERFLPVPALSDLAPAIGDVHARMVTA